MTPRGGRRKTEARARARIHWKKAARFAAAARANAEKGLWDPAVSDAVHAVINIVDAVCVHYLGERSASESHHDAVEVLRDAPGVPPATRDALVKHLGALLTHKGRAQYEGRLLEEGEAVLALKHLERAFQAMHRLAVDLGWEPNSQG